MPFINVKVTGPQLERLQIATIQKEITRLMGEVLDKVPELTGVLIEQVPNIGWSVGARQVERAVYVDATVSAGTNTASQKADFIRQTNEMLRTVLGPDLASANYIVIHDVPKDSWGYDGQTQEHRAKTAGAS